MIPFPLLLTKQQLADELSCSIASVHRLMKTGKIPHVKLGPKLIRFNKEAVIKALGEVPANEGN